MEYNAEWLGVVRVAIYLGKRTGRKRRVFGVLSRGEWLYLTLPIPDLPIGGPR